MSVAARHPNLEGFQAELTRIAGMARRLSDGHRARLCILGDDGQTDFHEDGQVSGAPLDARLADIGAATGLVSLSKIDADDDHEVAIPLHICDGALLGALTIVLPARTRLKPSVCRALEDLGALAAFVACEWVRASDRAWRASSTAAQEPDDELIWELDADLRFHHCSTLSGVGTDQVIGQRLSDMREFVADAAAWARHMADIAARRAYQDFTFDVHRDGRDIRIVSSGYPVFAADGAFEGYRGLSREYDQGGRAKPGLKAARFDAVTGLMNRATWSQCLRRLLPGDQAHTDAVALLLIDIDHFKRFNQRYGHSTADGVLAAVARRLENTIRVHDRLARVGSDEFAIIATAAGGPDAASELAERLEEAFVLPVEVGRHTIDVSITTGIALAPRDGTAADELVASAGLAQAFAKLECRGRHRLYDPGMRQQMQTRVVLDDDLQKAVAAHEFELFFQPQIRLSDHRIVGAEALLRWRHPQRGLIAPGQFIAALEESDYAISVGNWVIQEAARRAKAWSDAGFEIRVAVNLSAGHFSSFDVVDLIRDTLCKTGLEPRLLEMEITENAFLQSGENGRALIAKLRETGISISFDDFGTGYGSLSDLRSVPVDRIKIDRTFITDSLSSPSDASIVQAIISLARNLGLATVAEGVEDEAQEALLKLFGCDEVQGFLYSKPVPAAAFERILNDNEQQEAEDRREAARLMARA